MVMGAPVRRQVRTLPYGRGSDWPWGCGRARRGRGPGRWSWGHRCEGRPEACVTQAVGEAAFDFLELGIYAGVEVAALSLEDDRADFARGVRDDLDLIDI